MTLSVFKLGLLGAVSATAYFLYPHFDIRQLYILQTQQQDNRPIQEILKQIFIRVSTKENMGVVNEMYKLTCLQNEELLKPYDYTLKTGGKKIRLIMAVIVAQLFTGHIENIPKEVLQVGGLIELLHSASLVIDDIQDGSIQRRGQSCSHLVFGVGRSINAANLMYFLPFKKLYNSIENPKKKLEILKIFIEQMTLSHMGQAQDIRVHKAQSQKQLPLLEEYELLTIAKTGSLLRMMVKMLCVLLGRSKQEQQKLCEIMNYVALAFQVTDDVLNLTHNLGKGDMAEDLKEKKFTPVINHMRSNPQFIELFVKEQKDDETIKKMLKMIVESQSLESTKNLAEKYQQKAQNLIKQMKTPYSKSNFKKLVKFIITRQN